MADDPPLVSVITITRTRPRLLQRAIAAVARQSTVFVLEHLIVVDDCADTATLLRALPPMPHLSWRVEARADHEHSGPGRSSALRNIGVERAGGRWIAFLDDDNDWEDDHLQSLVDLATLHDVPAVHSAMRMFHRDGRPYVEHRVPWARDRGRAATLFDALVESGVATPGSNVFLDRADPPEAPGGVQSVDTGEWLLRRDLLLEHPFTSAFGPADEANLIGEDDKLMTDLLAAGIRPISTGRPTLHYYVGGYSNNFNEPFDDTFSWRTRGEDM